MKDLAKAGTQEWYDNTRREIVEVSKKLRLPETSKEEKDRLYSKQLGLVDELFEYSHEGLVNNPIE